MILLLSPPALNQKLSVAFVQNCLLMVMMGREVEEDVVEDGVEVVEKVEKVEEEKVEVEKVEVEKEEKGEDIKEHIVVDTLDGEEVGMDEEPRLGGKEIDRFVYKKIGHLCNFYS